MFLREESPRPINHVDSLNSGTSPPLPNCRLHRRCNRISIA